jgi:endonuclease IV
MFGIHISKQSILGNFNKLEDAVENITNKYNLKTCQIFTHGPQTRKKNNYNSEKLKKIKNVNIFVHSTYLTDGYWNAVERNAPKRYFKHIQEQLDATDEIGGNGLVIHITRTTIPIIKKGLDLLYENIKQPKNVKILLEFRAMKPGNDCSYETAEKLNNLYYEIKNIKLNWGFCIDTSHMWATGVDMSNANIVKTWLKDIKCKNKIKLIHLNASSNDTFNLGKDVHIVPFTSEDNIWGDTNNDAFKILLSWIKKNKVPMIGEFKRGTKTQFEYAISYLT